jgi:hypothetical protein
VNKVFAAIQSTIKPIGHIACDLLHPARMRFRNNPGNVHVSGGEPDDEENVVADESKCRPDLHGEEVTSGH